MAFKYQEFLKNLFNYLGPEYNIDSVGEDGGTLFDPEWIAKVKEFEALPPEQQQQDTADLLYKSLRELHDFDDEVDESGNVSPANPDKNDVVETRARNARTQKTIDKLTADLKNATETAIQARKIAEGLEEKMTQKELRDKERSEARRKSDLVNQRTKALAPFGVDVSGYDFSEMSDTEFNLIFEQAQANFQAMETEKQKQVELSHKQGIAGQRIEAMTIFGIDLSGYDFAEMSDADFQTLYDQTKANFDASEKKRQEEEAIKAAQEEALKTQDNTKVPFRKEIAEYFDKLIGEGTSAIISKAELEQLGFVFKLWDNFEWNGYRLEQVYMFRQYQVKKLRVSEPTA